MILVNKKILESIAFVLQINRVRPQIQCGKRKCNPMLWVEDMNQNVLQVDSLVLFENISGPDNRIQMLVFSVDAVALCRFFFRQQYFVQKDLNQKGHLTFV